MSEFVVNGDMFGMYAKIPTGFSKEMHTYKIVSVFESNTYCDVPLLTIDTKETTHDKLDTVLNVIHCGIDGSEVIRVTLKDCEVFKKETLEIHNIPIQCVDGSCPIALSDEYAERGMDIVHSCAECQYQPQVQPIVRSTEEIINEMYFLATGDKDNSKIRNLYDNSTTETLYQCVSIWLTERKKI